jgi:hypothetical protein
MAMMVGHGQSGCHEHAFFLLLLCGWRQQSSLHPQQERNSFNENLWFTFL